MKRNRLLFKNIAKFLLLLLCLAGLWSCGGGGGGGGGEGSANNDQPQNTVPVITTQPRSTTVTAGRTATFTVVARGTAPLSYQWQKDGANVGTDSASYTTPETTMEDSGAKFTVVVTNTAGHADSEEATLTVKASALDLPKDAEGWTIFTPSLDTRIMYISESGNDSTGAIYNLTSNPNPFNPSGTIQAFATYAGAYAHTRDGYPDWILYKRGETFYDAPARRIRNGRSRSEPFLIGSYGSTGESPLIKAGAGSGVAIARESPSTPATYEYIAIQGLRFYAHTRNPADPDFAGYLGGGGVGMSITTYNAGNIVKNILVEGCAAMYFSTNVIVQGAITDIDIRRNAILHAYAIDSHAQGLFASGVNRFLVEDNVFDHNGWLIQSSGNDRTNGGATFHNHNIYTDGVQNATFRNNLFMRASSIGTKLQNEMVGLIVDNNLYIDGELGIESCNNYPDNYYRVHAPVISNNVFYQLGLSNPTLRNVGWGMWLQGWDGGLVHNNLLLGQRGQMFINLGLRSRGTEIFNNIGMLTGMYAIYHSSTAALTDLKIHDNYFERLDGEVRMVESTGASLDGIDFSNNTYYSSNTPEFRINSTIYNPAQWAAGFESDAQFTKRTFPDASRTVETYMTSIGQTDTLDAFIEKCRAQDRYNWDDRYTAESVNSWIKAGF